jgi:hypothetical protein
MRRQSLRCKRLICETQVELNVNRVGSYWESLAPVAQLENRRSTPLLRLRGAGLLG